MKLLAFAVRDSKMELFQRPFFAETKGAALRAFRDACKEPGHEFNKHAEDYTLFHIGLFDMEKGELQNGVCDSIGFAATLKES